MNSFRSISSFYESNNLIMSNVRPSKNILQNTEIKNKNYSIGGNNELLTIIYFNKW